MAMVESGQRLDDLINQILQPLDWKRYSKEGMRDTFRANVNDKGIEVSISRICIYRKGFDFYDKNGKWEDDRCAREYFAFGEYNEEQTHYPILELYKLIEARMEYNLALKSWEARMKNKSI